MEAVSSAKAADTVNTQVPCDLDVVADTAPSSLDASGCCGRSVDGGDGVHQLGPDVEVFKFKTRICSYWRKGFCHNGDLCSFAHGEEEREERVRAAPAGVAATPPQRTEEEAEAEETRRVWRCPRCGGYRLACGGETDVCRCHFPRTLLASELAESDDGSVFCGPPSEPEDHGTWEVRALEVWDLASVEARRWPPQGAERQVGDGGQEARVAARVDGASASRGGGAANAEGEGEDRRPSSRLIEPKGKICGRHQKFICVFHVGIEDEQEFCLVKRILGRAGNNMRAIADDFNAKLRLRGIGSGFLEGSDGTEANIPLQLNVSCADYENYRGAVDRVARLLEELYRHYRRYAHSKGWQSPDVALRVEELRRDDLSLDVLGSKIVRLATQRQRERHVEPRPAREAEASPSTGSDAAAAAPTPPWHQAADCPSVEEKPQVGGPAADDVGTPSAAARDDVATEEREDEKQEEWEEEMEKQEERGEEERREEKEERTPAAREQGRPPGPKGQGWWDWGGARWPHEAPWQGKERVAQDSWGWGRAPAAWGKGRGGKSWESWPRPQHPSSWGWASGGAGATQPQPRPAVGWGAAPASWESARSWGQGWRGGKW